MNALGQISPLFRWLFSESGKMHSDLTAAKNAFRFGMKQRQASAYRRKSDQFKAELQSSALRMPHRFSDGLNVESRLAVMDWKETWVAFDELGAVRPYRKSFGFPGTYINEDHEFLATCPRGMHGSPICINIGISGWLQSADALKLYELAYYADGDVLEVGTYNGLSASIIAQANAKAKSSGCVVTVDVDSRASRIARKNLFGHPGYDRVEFNVGEGAEFMERMRDQGRKFGFIFIDHWHGYEATYDAADMAASLLASDGFLLFHDFNDPCNADPGHHYGVYQAVLDSVCINGFFEFFGCFGCCALFRRKAV